jgi:hypothetical protein
MRMRWRKAGQLLPIRVAKNRAGSIWPISVLVMLPESGSIYEVIDGLCLVLGPCEIYLCWQEAYRRSTVTVAEGLGTRLDVPFSSLELGPDGLYRLLRAQRTAFVPCR